MSFERIAIAINSYNLAIANETSLWTMYVVATFAAAGFGIGSETISNYQIAFAVAGFLAFTVGQFVMVKMSIAKRKKIKLFLEKERPGDQSLIAHVVKEKIGFWGAVVTHIVIDSCVVGLFLQRYVNDHMASR